MGGPVDVVHYALGVLQHRAVLLDQNVPELGGLDGEHPRGARDPQVEMEYLVERQCCSEREILKKKSLYQSIAMVSKIKPPVPSRAIPASVIPGLLNPS